jgi:hypothetical protein
MVALKSFGYLALNFFAPSVDGSSSSLPRFTLTLSAD